jgi:hypothetical protein
MKSKAYHAEARSSEKDFETLQLGAFTNSRFAPRLRARRFNCGIGAQRRNDGFVARGQDLGSGQTLTVLYDTDIRSPTRL